MSGLDFTEEVARQLEATYMTSDVVSQRRATLALVDLSKGDRVLDIGSGPGFLCETVADLSSSKASGIEDVRSRLL